MPDCRSKMRELIEACTSKRMITSVGALIVFSVLIVMIEEMAEEHESWGDFDVKKATGVVDAKGATGISEPPEQMEAKVDDTCHEREPTTFLQACAPCTDFERKAIKSRHCVQTGFYDRLRCTNSGALSFRPCTPAPSRHSLTTFFVSSLIVAAVASFVAHQRKGHLERFAYSRLAQNAHGFYHNR